jgi:phage terminase large subunit-like protein
LAGKEVVSHYVHLAVERQQYDLQHGAERGLKFEKEKVDRVITFFQDNLHHWKGEWAGQIVHLEDWQQWMLGVLFGWIGADGYRRFRRLWMEVARKNGKSFIAAGIGLYLMDFDNEPGAEIFAIATKREQVTRYIWRDACQMVAASPDLARRIHRFRASNTLVCEETESSFQALGSDASTLDALNVHGGLLDEVHEHPTLEIHEKIETGMGARRQPMLCRFTTAGDESPGSPYEQLHEYAANVVEGFREKFVDDREFVFLACLDADDDPFNEACWAKANPNLGVSVKLAFLREQAVKAKNEPAFLPTFLRYHCNRRAHVDAAPIPLDLWDACEDPSLRDDDLAGRDCYGGLDLATTTDLAALGRVYPEIRADGSEGIVVKCDAWCPDEGIDKRARTDGAPYAEWASQHWLTATAGNIIDYRFIEDTLGGLAAKVVFRDIGFDKAKAADVCIRLADAGLPLTECPQGPLHMTAPFNRLLDLVRSGRLRHDGNPLLRWCIGNLRVKDAAGGLVRIVKANQRARIDGAVGILMALARLMLATPEAGNSYSDDYDKPLIVRRDGGGSYGKDYSEVTP